MKVIKECPIQSLSIGTKFAVAGSRWFGEMVRKRGVRYIECYDMYGRKMPHVRVTEDYCLPIVILEAFPWE